MMTTPADRSMKKPLAACSRQDCGDCGLASRANCHQGPREITDFLSLAATYFIPFVGGMISGQHFTALLVWAGLAAIFFLFGQQRLICRRCPQYASPRKLLLCHAAPWLPKLPRYHPRPLSFFEHAALVSCTAVLFLYYVPFFIISAQWLLLAVTTWSLLAWAWTVKRQLCSRCINLFCPFNGMPLDSREKLAAAFPDLRPALEARP
jgi:hypothetical protein